MFLTSKCNRLDINITFSIQMETLPFLLGAVQKLYNSALDLHCPPSPLAHAISKLNSFIITLSASSPLWGVIWFLYSPLCCKLRPYYYKCKKNTVKISQHLGCTIKLRNFCGYYSKRLYIFLLSVTD